MSFDYYAKVVTAGQDKSMIDFTYYFLENTHTHAVFVYKYGT